METGPLMVSEEEALLSGALKGREGWRESWQPSGGGRGRGWAEDLGARA